MTPPPIELQLALVRAHQAGDVAAARAIAAKIRQASVVAAPPPPPEGGGFIPGVKVGGAGVLGSLAQPVEDVTGMPTALGEYAQQVQRETPQAFTSVGAFADRPLTSIAEITGAQVPTTGAIVAGAGAGRKLGGMAGRAAGAVPWLRAVPEPIRVKAGEEIGENVGAFLPSFAMQYQEARQEQDEAGTRNIPKAIIAAGGGALAEQFGLESMARRALFGKTKPGKNRAIEAGKSAVLAAPIESATEVGQTAASLWAADRDLQSPESIEKLQMAGLGGFVGGGVLGGALGAAQKPEVKVEQPPPPPGPAIAPDPQTEIADDIDPAILLAEADQEALQEPPVAEEQRGPGRQEPAQEGEEAVGFPDIVVAPDGRPFRTAAQAAIFRARNKLPDREVIRMPEGGFMLAKPISVTEMQAEEVPPIQQPPEPDELQAAQAYDRQILDAIALGDVELADQLRAERDALPPLEPVPTEGIEVSYQPPQAPEGEGRMEVSYPEVENITLSTPPEAPKAKAPEAEAVVLQNRDRSSAASIEQMNAIAANPDPARLSFSRDLSAGAPVVFRQDDRMPAILGRKDVVTDASGKKIPIQYALVEADEVVASNRADGLPDPEYVNPERTRAVAGNGRVAGLKAAFERGTAPAYVEGIAADTDLHGIPQQAVRALNKPILVRVMRAQDVTPDIGDRSNIQTAARLSPIEQARTDAARVDLANLDFDDAGRPTQESLTAFVNAMPQTEQSELRLRAGQTGRQASDRLMAAVFAKAYADPALVELYAQASDPEAKAVMSALAGAAGAMQKLEGAGDLDVRGIVVEAARAAVNAARRGQKLQTYANQGDLNIEPDAFRVIRFMAANSRSGKAMAEGLRNLANLAYAEAQKPDADMFGPVERATRSQVLEVLDEKTPVAVPGRAEAAGRDTGVREPDGTDAGPVPELTLTTQTEDDFRRQDAERKQREADERERERRAKADSEPFRLTGSEREADQAAAAGQVALPLEAEKPKAARPSVVPSAVFTAVQQDLFAGYPETKGQYATEAELVKTGTREIGAAKVTDTDQAAKALSYLGRNAVERFDALVTDKDGEPLAIVGGFKGTIDAASIHIRTLIGEVFGLPGAARVWFAHNHPSGNAALSTSDLRLADAARKAFLGTKVQVEGIFAFAGTADGPRKWTFDDGSGMATKSGVAPAFAQARAVPVMERILSRSGTLGPNITAQSEAIAIVPAIARDRGGIVMLNSQHTPIGFAPIPKADQFRDTGALDNLYEAMAMGNAHSAIIANPNNQYSLAEMMNLAAAVQRGGMQVRILDSVSYSYADGKPSNINLLSKTSPLATVPGAYKSIARKKASSTVKAARAAAVKKYGEQGIENLERSGILRILDSADLPKEIYDPEADALYDPKTATAYIIADRVSDDRVPQLLLHEIGEHYGLPRMLGAKKYNELIQQVRQMIADGKDPELNAAVQDVRDNYALDENRTLFVREVIARYSENPGKAQWWQDLVAMVRQFLRDLGVMKNMSPKDVAYLVRQSLRQAMRTAPLAQYPGRPIESPTMAAKEPTQAALMRSMMADTFYSALLRSVQEGKGAPKRGDAKMWKGWLDGAQRRGEFRQSERDWLGVDAWLDARETVTRDELADFIRANEVQVQDVVLGEGTNVGLLPAGWEFRETLNGWAVDDADGNQMGHGATQDAALAYARGGEPSPSPTKFGQWQVPGGENYRELLLTLPVKEDRVSWIEWAQSQGIREGDVSMQVLQSRNAPDNVVTSFERHMFPATRSEESYSSPHFDQPNVLAHIRFNERTDADGNRVLFLEEIQSDWHQAGRKRGYNRLSDAERAELLQLAQGPMAEQTPEQRLRFRELKDREDFAAPDAPFKATDEWAMLAFKRMVRWAAENGFERIAWTTGAQQADRYDLRKSIEEIHYSGSDLRAYDKQGKMVISRTGVREEDLPDLIGKEAADKLLAAPKRGTLRSLTGAELEVGGEGMRAFYDSILPKAVNKWAKRFGGKVSEAQVAVKESSGEALGAGRTAHEVIGPDGQIYDAFDTRQAALDAAEDAGAGYSVRSPERGGFAAANSIDLTPAMRAAALAGQPMFSRNQSATLPDTIEVDGVRRPTTNSNGRPIAATEEGVRNFWRWFGDSKVVDDQGRPLVVYHGTTEDFASFDKAKIGANYPNVSRAFYFSATPSGAADYALDHAGASYARPGMPGVFAGSPADTGAGGSNIMPVYLRITNPLRKTALGNFSPEQWLDKHRDKLLEQARAGGHDGIVIEPGKYFGDRGPVYAVLEPEQIKSATGNAGTFDPADPNIMFSRNPARSVLPDETSFESIVRLMQNQMNRWDKGLDYLRKKGGNIVTYKTDVSSIEKLFYGKAQNDYNIMKRRFMAPIEKILKQNDLSLDELDEFAMYRHAPERNDAIAEIDPTKPDGGSGIMTEDAKKYMQELTGERRAALTKAGDLLVEMNRWRLEKQRDRGLISDEEFRVLTEKYKFYVPLKSVKEPEDVVDGLGTTGYSVRGKEFQRALGRTSEAASPYLVSVMDATRAILRAQENVVGNAAYELALNPGARELVEVVDPASVPEQFQIKKIYKVAKKDANGRVLRRPVMEDGKQMYRNGKAVTEPVMEERVAVGIDPSYPNSRNIFATKIKGETKYVLIKDERMAEQLKKMGEAEMNAFMETLNRATGLMGRMFTQYNPAFIPINFMRDWLTVTINSLGVPGMSPGRVFAGTLDSIPAIYSHLFGDGSSKLTPVYNEFLEDGATTGGLGLTGITQAGKELQERGVRLKAGESAPVRQAIGRMKDMLDVVSNVNEVFENATRFSVYRNAREVFTQQNLDAGMSQADAVADARQRAAVLAREISVDFNKRGEYSRMMNSFYVFFNAAVQGVRSFYKFTMTSQQKNRVQQALFAIMMSGVALRFANHIFGGFDDELGEEKALSFDAQATMSAPLLIGDTVIKFPLPYIYNIPFVLGYRVADMYITGRVGHNLKEIAMTVSGALSPLGEPKVASGTPAGFIAKTFSPSVIQPMADILDNTNFYGGPIAKTPSLWDKAPPPRAYDHWKGSSEAGVAVAKMLNYMTGGDKYEPGWLNVAPEWLDYVASYYAGGPGRFIKQTYALVTPDEAGQETPKSQYPVIGRLYAERQPRYYVNGRFREMQTDLEYVKKRIEDRGSDVQPEDRRLVAIFESTEKRLRVMQKQLNKAMDAGEDERAQMLRDRIQEQKARAIKSYNVVKGRYDEAMAGAPKAEAAELFRQNGYPAMAGLIEETR
jgi:hypothetical protein